MYKDIGTLQYIEHGQDKDGFPKDHEIPYEVYLRVMSVKRSEFYAAMQAGHKPSIVFGIRTEDYEQTKHIVDNKAIYAQKMVYDGATYNIVRTYQKSGSETELTCE